MIYFSVPFGFYSGDCFDKAVVIFISWICVCECPLWINCPWQTFVSADVVSLSLLFFFIRVYSVFYVSAFVLVFIHVCIHSGCFCFYPLLLSSPKIINVSWYIYIYIYIHTHIEFKDDWNLMYLRPFHFKRFNESTIEYKTKLSDETL